MLQERHEEWGVEASVSEPVRHLHLASSPAATAALPAERPSMRSKESIPEGWKPARPLHPSVVDVSEITFQSKNRQSFNLRRRPGGGGSCFFQRAKPIAIFNATYGVIQRSMITLYIVSHSWAPQNKYRKQIMDTKKRKRGETSSRQKSCDSLKSRHSL